MRHINYKSRTDSDRSFVLICVSLAESGGHILYPLLRFRMQCLYLLTTFTVVYCYPALRCLKPHGSCTPDLQCTVSKPEDCTNGQFKPNVSDCGCCPACIKYLGECDNISALRCCEITLPATHAE
jgi:hypothetical protein